MLKLFKKTREFRIEGYQWGLDGELFQAMTSTECANETDALEKAREVASEFASVVVMSRMRGWFRISEPIEVYRTGVRP